MLFKKNGQNLNKGSVYLRKATVLSRPTFPI